MSIINISEVSQLISSAENVDVLRTECAKNGIVVKQSGDLIVLANANENVYYKTRKPLASNASNASNLEETETSNAPDVYDDANLNVVNVVDDVNETLRIQANGVIFEESTRRIVAACQPKLIELESLDQVTNVINDNPWDSIRMEYCEDGTVIRLYNYNNNWFTATTRCVDASNSYWSSERSFNSLFWDVFDKHLVATLDKNYTYVFILLHKENRIVVKHNRNTLVYISRIHNTTLQEDYQNYFRNVETIRRPKMITVEQYLNMYRTGVVDNKYKRGIIVKVYDHATKYWTLSKFDFPGYRLIKSIRGNVPELRMRYLELINKPESLELLEKIYGENHFMFTYIKVSLLKLVKTVYRLYIESHIRHTTEIKSDNIYFITLRQLHAQYKLTGKPISFEDVQKRIYSLNKTVLKRLLAWQ